MKAKIDYITQKNHDKDSYQFMTEYINKNARKWCRFYPNLTGISLAHKIKNGKKYKSFSVVFHVKKKEENPKNPLPKTNRIQFRKNKYKNILSDVVEYKGFEFRNNPNVIELGEIALQRNTGEWGTIGCLLNANNGDKYICTNMHVLRKNDEQTEFFRPKEEQNQPDVFLKDIESGTIINAFFERGTMNGTDLAIARIQNNQLINFRNIIVDNGIPTGFLVGDIGDFSNLAINIRGARTLENVSGRIIGQTSFPSENIFNLLQAEIFSQNGDSGSPIFDDSLNLLGILVGGEINNHNISYIIPINQILDFINNDENIKNLNLSIQINQS